MADLHAPFEDFLFDALKEYRESLGGTLPARMWKEAVRKFKDDWDRARKGPSKRLAANPAAERIYGLYPKKVGKKAAIEAISKVLERMEEGELADRVHNFASYVDRWPKADHQFVPYPATWFNEGRYDDDPNEWERPGMKPVGSLLKPAELAEPFAALEYFETHYPEWIHLEEYRLRGWSGLSQGDKQTVIQMMQRK